MRRTIHAMRACVHGILIAVMCGMLLAACGGREDMRNETDGYYSCLLQELSTHLAENEADFLYLCGYISIDGYSAESWSDIQAIALKGEASVTWKSCESLMQLEGELSQWTKDRTGEEASLELLYYSFPLPEDIHALDIYRTLEERFSTEDLLLEARCGENGSPYYSFTWISPDPDREGWYYWDFNRAPVNLYIKDGFVRGLAIKGGVDVYTDQELGILFREYEKAIGCSGSGTWALDEEDLYWLDHEQRVTEMEDANRRFVEIRSLETISNVPEIKRYFGIIKEADYEVALSEGGPMIQIHMVLPEKPAGEEYTCLPGFCRKESYAMTVTDKESGRVLQEGVVNHLCIRLPDTIFFGDYDGDGYIDIRIDSSAHMSARLEGSYYMLWNSFEGGFEEKTREEVSNRYWAVRNNLTEEEQREKTQREKVSPFALVEELPEGADQKNYIELTMDCEDLDYVVQPGDSLWGISNRFLGAGSYWNNLERMKDASENPDLLSVGEIIHISGELGVRKKLYIPRDSRYGSNSSASIQHPGGFSYRYIATDVTYYKWDEMNVIYCLATYNEVGENALSEEWEAFQAEIIRCSEEICPGRVSNLQFEKYSVQGGCDLYGYSFEYDAVGRTMEYTAFIRLDSSLAVEIIGIREKEPNTVMTDTVRYIAASFVDRGGYPEMGTPGSLGDNVGADDWAYPWLHNLFTAAKEQFG